MAGALSQEFGLSTKLTPGNRGEFTVWLRGQKVAEMGDDGFPAEREVVTRVGQLISG